MDKIVIALNLVIDYIDSDDVINEKDITDYLFKTGFEDHEIRQVLSLLNMSSLRTATGVRYFTEKEKKLLTLEAMEYLQKLYLTGILDPVSMEEIMETAFDTDAYKVDIEQIKNYVLITLMESKSLSQPSQDSFEEYSH